MTLKFQWLYAFQILAEEMHFQRAAQRLAITQQALSKTMAQLESALELRLFQRNPLNLSPEGKRVLLQTQSLLEALESLETQCARLQSIKGHFRIGCLSWISPTLSQRLVPLLASHPEASVSLHVYPQFLELQAALLHRQVDLGLSPVAERHPDLDMMPYLTSKWVLAAAPQSREAQEKTGHLITPRVAQATRQLFHWPHHWPGFEAVSETELALALEAALSGRGALWAPHELVHNALEQGQLLELPVPFAPSLDWQLLWSKNHSPLVQAFLAQLRVSAPAES